MGTLSSAGLLAVVSVAVLACGGADSGGRDRDPSGDPPENPVLTAAGCHSGFSAATAMDPIADLNDGTVGQWTYTEEPTALAVSSSIAVGPPRGASSAKGSQAKLFECLD